MSSSFSFSTAPPPAAAAGGSGSGGAFHFGGTAAPAAPAFGATATATPAPSAGASSTSTSSFAFGGGATFGAATPAAPAATFGAATTATTTTPAPSAGAGTSNSTSFAFGGANQTPAAASTTSGPPLANKDPSAATLVVPSLDELYPAWTVWHRLSSLLTTLQETTAGSSTTTTAYTLAGQELLHLTQCHAKVLLLQEPPSMMMMELASTPPNPALRQALHQRPILGLSGGNDGGGGTTTLTLQTLQDILQLADALQIPEAQAATLYIQAVSHPQELQALLGRRSSSSSSTTTTTTTTMEFCQAFHGQALWLPLACTLKLIHARLSLSSTTWSTNHQHSQQHYIVQATNTLLQQGWISNLCNVVQSTLQRLQSLRQQSQSQQSQQPVPFQPSSVSKTSTSSIVLLQQDHLCQGRAMACEALYFLAYQVSWEWQEVVTLVQTMAMVSQPFTKSASTSHVWTTTTTSSTSLGQSSSSPQPPFGLPNTTMSKWEWQDGLVQHTQDAQQDWMCTAVLVTTLQASLDPTAMDDLQSRTEHGTAGISDLQQNANGMSKAIAQIQLGRSDLNSLVQLAVGLFCEGTNHPSLYAPADELAWTMCRLTLIPSLQAWNNHRNTWTTTSSAAANLVEFTLATLCQAFVRYCQALPTDGFPLSRAQWLTSAQDALTFQQEQAAQQAQFAAWQGTAATTTTTMTVPSSVDLMERPDCWDDLIVLGMTFGSLGPEYAHMMNDGLRKSCLLFSNRDGLGPIALQKDTSLLPSYLSWMAALCQDAGLATEMHAELTDIYPQIWSNLRWYVQTLSPYEDDKTSSSSSNTTTTTGSYTAGKTNTDYYYNLEGNMVEDDSRAASFTAAGSSTTTTTTTSSTTTSSSKSKFQELSDHSRYYISSHLALLRNIAEHCPQARIDFLQHKMNPDGASVTAADTTLLLLFQLAICPLPPTLRGAVLATIASFLKSNPAETTVHPVQQEQARNAWEYLETCPLLPIALVDQYTTVDWSASSSSSVVVGLAMPSSSTKLANLSDGATSVLPKESMYGLFYEMEHVESQLGWYPATEGCLELLESLVKSGGCPEQLGQGWRLRTGITPYLEYVTDLVLPRAFGLRGMAPLPFRVPGDQARLVTKALSVVQAILVRYQVPVQALKVKVPTPAAKMIPSLQSKLVVDGSDAGSVLDYSNQTVSSVLTSSTDTKVPASSLAATTTAPVTLAGPTTLVGNIPRAKSPGFYILADILSTSGGGGLLQALATVLAGSEGASGIAAIFGQKGHEKAVAYATFGRTIPDFESAKEGTADGTKNHPLHAFLKPLHPAMTKFVSDEIDFDRGIQWRESAIVVALEILCASTIREDAFCAAVSSSKTPLKMVPTLRFQKIRYGSSNLKIIDISPVRLSNLLYSTSDAQYIRAAIVEYIGYTSAEDDMDANLSSAALCLTHLLHAKMRLRGGIQALTGPDAPKLFSSSVASRLLVAARRSIQQADTESTSLILEWILAELRQGRLAEGGVAQVLLGLPSLTEGGNWAPETPSSRTELDCFDAILHFTRDLEYTASKSKSATAALCLEILFRLYDMLGNGGDGMALRTALYTAQRLRAVEFWKTNLILWLSSRASEPLVKAGSLELDECNPDALHCIAWLLKGLACELGLLMGLSGSPAGAIADTSLVNWLAPRPVMCQQLLDLLFASEEPLVIKLIHNLPIENISLDSSSLAQPPNDAIRKGQQCWPGPHDVTSGYFKIDKYLVLQAVKGMDDDEAGIAAWVDQWNKVVGRNCAACHLANSVAMMLGVVLECNSVFPSYADVSSSTLIPPSIVGGLSAMLLDRLLEGSDARSSSGMDESSYANATRYISNAILCLADALVDDSNKMANSTTPPIERMHLISLMAQAIVYSSVGDRSDAQAPIRNERTSVLSNAMCLLLKTSVKDEPDLLMQYQDDLMLAGKTLVEMSSPEVSTQSSESNNAIVVLARNCLCTLLESVDEIGMGAMFTFSLFNPSIVKHLVALIKRMDLNICTAFLVISAQGHGRELLIQGGLMEAMEGAARSYIEEERKVTTQLEQQANGGLYYPPKLLAPDFLMGHLKLLASTLSWTAPNSIDKSVFEASLRILAHYKPIFHRLCMNFPVEVDLFRACLRCLVLAAKSGPRQNDIRSPWPHSMENFGDIGLSSLCQELLDHPLEPSLLPPLPAALERLHDKAQAAIGGVNLSKREESQSWWHVLDYTLKDRKTSDQFLMPPPIGSKDYGYWNTPPSQWTESKYEYAILAVEILGLLLELQTIQGDKNHAYLHYCRGLYRSVEVLLGIQRRSEELDRPDSPADSLWGDDHTAAAAAVRELQVEYLKLLRANVEINVERLLSILYQCRAKKENLNLAPEQAALEAALAAIPQVSFLCSDRQKSVIGATKRILESPL